jgi:hypothetical protein
MRKTMIGILAATSLGATGCGGGSTFANKPRPPTPIDLTVYVNNARVSISPTNVGAGPVIFIVTNQAAQNVSLSIQAAGGGESLATTGPINPQATTQVQVAPGPGDYTIAVESGGTNLASQAAQTSITAATLHVGPPRPSSSNVLLQP